MNTALEDLKWLIDNGYIKMKGYQEDIVMLDCINNIEKNLKKLEEIESRKKENE